MTIDIFFSVIIEIRLPEEFDKIGQIARYTYGLKRTPVVIVSERAIRRHINQLLPRKIPFNQIVMRFPDDLKGFIWIPQLFI